MDTLHRLAGVTEASNTNEPPSQPVPEPPPMPQDWEGEPQSESPQQSARASRASLPLNRQPSHKSFRSSKHQSRSTSVDAKRSPMHPPADYPPMPQTPAQTAQARRSHESAGTGASSEDFQWGPAHPCFPHPNPHCPPDSEEFHTTRVIRVRRDWLQAGDLYPQYANLYPEILDPLVSDEDFRFLVSNLNGRLKAAFNPYTTRAFADAVLGAVTGYVWDDLGLTGSKQGVKGLEAFIDKWNAQREQEGKEVRLVQLRRTGFMALDFVVPDPGIDTVQEEDEQGGIEGGIGPAE